MDLLFYRWTIVSRPPQEGFAVWEWVKKKSRLLT